MISLRSVLSAAYPVFQVSNLNICESILGGFLYKLGDSCDADDDNDGVSDEKEIADRTDPFDRGSVVAVGGSGNFCAETNSFFYG